MKEKDDDRFGDQVQARNEWLTMRALRLHSWVRWVTIEGGCSLASCVDRREGGGVFGNFGSGGSWAQWVWLEWLCVSSPAAHNDLCSLLLS